MARFSILCAICQEDVRPGDEESPPVAVSCGHIFCSADIERHMARVKRPRKADCPVCRKPITHTTRLYPHIEEEAGGRRRVSGPGIAVESVVDRMVHTTELAERLVQGDGMEDDVMDVINSTERVVLELDAQKEAKILRATEPLRKEVEKLRKEYSHARRGEVSKSAAKLAAAQKAKVQLEEQNETLFQRAEQLVKHGHALQEELGDVRRRLAERDRKYQKLKREHAEAEERAERQRKTSRIKIAALEKEVRKYRPKHMPNVDDSLEIC